MRKRFCYSALSLLFCWSAALSAQATADAVTEAEDAFGYIVGDESVGIYDASSVRGFSLEAAGNYRVNGTYFVKSSGVSSFFLQSTAVRIGYNTFRLALPGPSGVVDYKLRDPARGEADLLTVGVADFGEKYAEVHAKGRTRDEKLSGSIGLLLIPELREAHGGKGSAWLLGGTARATLGATRFQLFGGEFQYRKDGQLRVPHKAGRTSVETPARPLSRTEMGTITRRKPHCRAARRQLRDRQQWSWRNSGLLAE